MDAKGLIIWLIIGAIAGWLAGTLVRGGGFGLVGDIIVGIIGAFIGGWLAGVLGFGAGGGLIASIITAPLSGWILTFSDWRALFIIEGVFPFLIAAPLWWGLVADHPREAKWCSPEERDYIEAGLAADRLAEEGQERRGLREFCDGFAEDAATWE